MPIVSFEPLAAPAAILEGLSRDDPEVRVVRAAVGSQRGTLTMHVTEEDDSSSPLDVGEAQHKAFGSVVVERREVPCGPLSDFLAPDDLRARNLLKIDTQGFELEVLRGAEDLLRRFDVIYCEASFVEFQALASEIIAHLWARRFVLAGVHNQTIAGDEPVQADMVFRRIE